MKQPLIRKEHLGPESGQRGLPRDLRAEAERRLQLAQSGTLNGSIATAYALLAIHDTFIKILDHLISAWPGDTSPIPRIPANACVRRPDHCCVARHASAPRRWWISCLPSLRRSPAAHTASGSR